MARQLGWVNIVDDGGKITPHHNAFFMVAGGSQMAGADITSDQPVRFVIEYADVSPKFISVALAYGSDASRVSPSPPTPAAGDPTAQAAPTAARAQPLLPSTAPPTPPSATSTR